MKPEDQKNDEDHETLVSYLDGELDPNETVEVENRLAEDPAYRNQLHALERTWDMLDVLPAVEPTESFTRSTLELVINDAKFAIQKKRKNWWATALKVATLIAVPCLCYAATAAILDWRSQKPVNELVNELPFLQKYELYESIKTIEFAELLNEQKLLADIEMSDSEFGSEKFAWEPSRTVLDNLNDEERADLRRAKLRFEGLTDVEKNALRSTHEQILKRDDRDELLSAMQRYQIWSTERTYSNSDINSLSDMEPTKAIAKVKEMLKSERESMASNSFPSADKDVVFKWFDRLIEDNEQKIRDQIVKLKKGREGRSLSRISADQSIDVLGFILIRMDHEFVMSLISDEELTDLTESVSSYSRRLITGKANPTEQRRFIVMMNSQIYVSQEKLRHFYDHELTSDDRRKLERYTGQELRDKVKEQYIRSRFRNESRSRRSN
jgi:hypothetical protein